MFDIVGYGFTQELAPIASRCDPYTMTLDDWHATSHTFSYRDHAIAYHDEGEGEALVCIHGFPTASWDWYRLWPSLTRHFRVISLDMLGFGFSAKPRNHTYSLFTQATLHEVILQHLGIHTIHLLAHDYGDTVVQELLARHLKRQAQDRPGLQIKSACLLNGGLFPEATRPRPIQKLLLGPLGWLVGYFMNEDLFSKNFSVVFGPDTQPTAKELADFWALITHQGGTRVVHKISQYQKERRQNRKRWVGALQKTTVPLRFINGPLDPVSGATMATRFRQLIPNPDVVVLHGIGHYPQIEAPDAVLEAFFSFIEKTTE